MFYVCAYAKGGRQLRDELYYYYYPTPVPDHDDDDSDGI